MSIAGFPVVIVSTGGIPVVEVTANAPLATVAANGIGVPIHLVERNGTPLIVDMSNVFSTGYEFLRDVDGYILFDVDGYPLQGLK